MRRREGIGKREGMREGEKGRGEKGRENRSDIYYVRFEEYKLRKTENIPGQ